MGEDNAVPARVIWQAHGLWTIATVKNRLNEMVKAGQIERRYLARSGKPNRHGRLFQKAASILVSLPDNPRDTPMIVRPNLNYPVLLPGTAVPPTAPWIGPEGLLTNRRDCLAANHQTLAAFPRPESARSCRHDEGREPSGG